MSSDEYDEYFITRYGLLYQKFSDSPFTGRIVTNESGPDGKFVIVTRVGETVRRMEPVPDGFLMV